MKEIEPATRETSPSVPDVARMKIRVIPATDWPADRRYSSGTDMGDDGRVRRVVLDNWQQRPPLVCRTALEASELARSLNGKAPTPGIDPEMAAAMGSLLVTRS